MLVDLRQAHMKKFTMNRVTCVSLLMALFCSGITLRLNAQTHFTAERVHLDDHSSIDAYFTDYQLVSLPSQAINDLVNDSSIEMDMEWIFPNGMHWELPLQAYHLRTENWQFGILESKDIRRGVPVNRPVSTFQSSIGDKEIRLTIRGDFIYGYLDYEGEEWYVEPARRFSPDLPDNTYLVYPRSAVRPMPGLRCGQTEKARIEDSLTDTPNRGGCQEVEMAVAADYSMYEYYGSAEAVLDYVEGVLNSVAGNFDDEFSTSIQLRLKELLISACAGCDPWYEGEEAITILEDFSEWGQAGGFTGNFDIGQFWSRRNYQSQGSGGVIGLAYVGTVCGDNAYQILEDFTASAGYLRVMTAHELGHNFGCAHNYDSGDYQCYASARPDFIMDPGVNLSTGWTNGELGYCESNSITRINTFLSENTCLLGCNEVCGMVSGLQTSFDSQLPALSLTWEGITENNWCVLLENLSTTEVDTFFTNEAGLILTGEVDLCSRYQATVAAMCDNEIGARQVLMLNTLNEAKLELLAAEPRACAVSSGTFDMELKVAYEETYSEGFTVWVDGQSYAQDYETSPQFVHLESLTLPEDGNVSVYVLPNINSSTSCGDGVLLSTPDRACNLVAEEHFNDCRLPLGWTCASTYPSGAEWQIGDSTRLTANFGVGMNSFDGSCMLYFDDDILGPYTDQSGSTYVLTPVYDFRDYETVELGLKYNFNAYYSAPHTRFTIEVFDGAEWVTLHTDQTGQGCVPSQSWNESCLVAWEADLSGYANPNFQLRFGYHDGGQWAEFVAIDDVMLRAEKNGALLPVDWGDFKAISEKEQVRLNWSTLQEHNNSGFYVERSSDGRSFKPLQFVAGTGDSDQLQAYFHLDTRPLFGTSYYRLHQVDLDGTSSYSEIREIHRTSGSDDWRIYPNPIGADGRLIIDGLSAEDLLSHVDLLSIDGRLLERFQLNAIDEQQTLQISATSLPSGVYLLRLSNGQTRRLMM